MTPAEVESLWQDGVVHLPGVLPLEWVAALVEPVERTVTTGEAVDLAVLATEGEEPTSAFAAGVDHWRN